MRSMFILLLLAVVLPAAAQTPLEQAFFQLQTGSELPEALQSSRSAVFLKVSPSESIERIPSWMPLAEELHKYLVSMSIDAVAYFKWQDLNSGFDATASYLETIRQREISQIIVLSKIREQVHLHIVPTSEEPGLFATSQPAWHTAGNTVEAVATSLADAVRRRGLEVANFLVVDSPEYFIDTEIFQKNRFESFQPDLKLDKLAVPLFFGPDPENTESPDDLTLQSIISTQYPFSYEFVAVTMTEDLMKKAGFQYVLRFLHGEEATLKTLLDYHEVAENPNRIIYKFYFKHLITGDIYLGDSWDSREQWQAALTVHLSNMKTRLNVE